MIDPPKGDLADHLSWPDDLVKNEGLTPVLFLAFGVGRLSLAFT
jgi:hypothetical protein